MAVVKLYPKRALLMAAALAVLATLVTISYFTRSVSIKAQPHPAPGFDRHAVIAITCPYPPYFGIGGENGIEWQLIVAAFADLGLMAQHLYVSHEDALRYFQLEKVTGVWVCGGMSISGEGYYDSLPLLERRFAVATLAEKELEFEQIETVFDVAVAVHPDVFQVLEPQLRKPSIESENVHKVANHALLASWLFTSRIDALITEESVFAENLRLVPNEADPGQPVRFHRLFESVYPRIVFKDEALRDRFNDALKETALYQRESD